MKKEPHLVLTELECQSQLPRLCTSLLQSSLSAEHAMPLLGDVHDNHDAVLLFLNKAVSRDGKQQQPQQQQLHGALESPYYMVNLVMTAESAY